MEKSMPNLKGLGFDFHWFWSQIEIRIGIEANLVGKLPHMQKPLKTNEFLMILMVRVFDCLEQKSYNIKQKSKLQPDLHAWSILDGFLVDFGSILKRKIDTKSIKKWCWKAMRRKKRPDQPRKRQPEAPRNSRRHVGNRECRSHERCPVSSRNPRAEQPRATPTTDRVSCVSSPGHPKHNTRIGGLVNHDEPAQPIPTALG